MSLIQRFFEPVKEMEPISHHAYRHLKHYHTCLKTMSEMDNQSIYVIDYYKKTFNYVSSHPLFLCGYRVEDVKKWGPAFFEKVVPAEDLKMILEIHEKALEFFYRLPFESRSRCKLSYDFRLMQPDGSVILANQMTIPFNLTQEGNLWLAMCVVNVSPNRQQGNVSISMIDEPVRYEYSFKSKKFRSIVIIQMSHREKQVLRHMKSGYTEEQIAQILCIAVDTVKYHKKNIFLKTGAKNGKQAIALARRLEMV